MKKMDFATITKSAVKPVKVAVKLVVKAPAKTAAKTKAKTGAVTLRHLAAALAETHGLSKKQSSDVLVDLIGMIGKHLKKGETVRIVGLGSLQVRKRAARIGRNPSTGEKIKIKASKKVAFRAAKDLKEAI